MRFRALSRDESGAILVISALSIVVLMVFAALTVDLGAAWSQRRQNQSAADAAVMAAALVPGETAPLEPAMVDAAIDYATRNLGGSFTPGSAAPAEWVSCSDPDRPLGFEPIRDINGTLIDCISIHGNGIVRVRLPVQNVPTAFARVIGIDEIATGAFAEADRVPAASGIRPFGITSGVPTGEVCLRTSSSPSEDCVANEQGEFRALGIAMYGDPGTGTDRSCAFANQGYRFKVNTARGVDHALTPRVADEYRLDGCSNNEPSGGTAFPSSVPTIQGIKSSLLLEALITETFPYDTGSEPATLALLLQGGNPKRTINYTGTLFQVDNKPLWEYIDTSYSAFTTVKTDCVDPAWSTLADADPEEASAQMSTCLKSWASIDGDNRLFDTLIQKSPRIAVVPEFVEDSWSGKSIDEYVNERTIDRWRTVFLNALNFNCGPAGCDIEFVPGSGSDTLNIPNKWKSLDQLTGFLLPIELSASKDAVKAATGVAQLSR